MTALDDRIYRKALAAGLPIVGFQNGETWWGTTVPTLEQRVQIEEIRIAVSADGEDAAADPENAGVYQGIKVFNADEVDRETSRAIRELIKPGRPEDVKENGEIAALAQAVAALLVKNDPASTPENVAAAEVTIHDTITLWGQIEAIRQAGRDFKSARGW